MNEIMKVCSKAVAMGNERREYLKILRPMLNKCPVHSKAFPYLFSQKLNIVSHCWKSSDFHLGLICGT